MVYLAAARQSPVYMIATRPAVEATTSRLSNVPYRYAKKPHFTTLLKSIGNINISTY